MLNVGDHSVQFSSVAQLCPTLCDPMNHSTPDSLSITNSQSVPKLMCIESVIPSNHLILCHPLLLLPLSFPASMSQHFAWGGQSTRVSALASFLPKAFQGLDLLAVQGTLKGLLQHHSSKASILRRSAFFTVPILTSIHDHWKNHSLDLTDLCWQSSVSAF